MRVTNKMMTNASLANINKNKVRISKLEEQYSTGKKIQRPSDDPVVAVRALKLRKNLSELNQYYEKNIPDAKSWMEATESALTNINSMLTNVNTYCDQGANDPLNAANRASVLANLQQISQQIYQEGNANYSDRYLFTGYKTDSSLIFNEDCSDYSYEITQKFKSSDILNASYTVDGYTIKDYDAATSTAASFATSPTTVDTHIIRLGYNTISNTNKPVIKYYTSVAADGSLTGEMNVDPDKIKVYSVSDDAAYKVPDDEVHVIKETGELVLGKNVYNTLQTAKGIQAVYEKNEFKENDLKPENYYTCVRAAKNPASPGSYYSYTDTDTTHTVKYTLSNQDITYEVNFRQQLKVNTQGKDAILPDLARQVDAITKAVEDVTAVENNLAEVNKKLADETITDTQREALTQLQSQLTTEHALKTTIMQNAFAKGLTVSKDQQDVLNDALADLGSRMVRLNLTNSRLSTQQTEFNDLLSSNEDADQVEVIVNYTTAYNIYSASLSAASKIAKTTLLDYI